MRDSIRIATIFDIPIRIHWSFGLIFIYVFYQSWSQSNSWLSVIFSLAMLIVLFSCVLLHEFGHSLTARRYGIETRDIILTPIGGVARLEGMPEKPVQEFWVALAGPAVNVAIVFVLFLLGKLMYTGDVWLLFKTYILDIFRPSHLEEGDQLAKEIGESNNFVLFFLAMLLSVNVMLVLFNLIPAFPMDGGRVFRSLLAMKTDRVRATRIASIIGQIFAVGFVLFGMYRNQPMLSLIGFFVFVNAGNEFRMVKLEAILNRFTAADIMRQQFTALYPSDWMQIPISLLQQNGATERNFVVVDFDGSVVGVLNEHAVLAALKKNDLSAQVSKFMDHQFYFVHPKDPLRNVYYFIKQKRQTALPVTHEPNGLVGVINEHDFDAFLRKNLKNFS